jgi:hypothetical protein
MDPELNTSPLEEAPEPASGLDAILDKAIAANDAAETPATEDAPSTETAEEREARRGNPYRAADGKFTSKDNAIEAAPSDGPAEAVAEPATTTPATEPAPQSLEPHPRWSETDKATFAKLPPDGQRLMMDSYKRMEADYTRKTQDVAETRNAIQPFVHTLTEWSPYLQEMGLPPSQAFHNLLSVEYTLRKGSPEQKREIIDSLIRDYQVSPSQTAAPTDPAATEWQDPAVLNLSQQLSAVKNELTHFKTEQQRQMQEAAMASHRAEFAAIGLSKNQDGSLRFPHFERVQKTMVDLVSGGQADTWDAAYDKAVRLEDDLYQEVLVNRERKALEAEEKRRQEAVNRARGVTPPAKTTPTVHSGNSKPKGLDAILSSQLDKAGLL